MSAEFSDKVAVITGASSGIGEATAVMMASQGANVTLCGRDETKLKKVADVCSKVSPRSVKSCLVVVGDVTSDQTRREILDKTVEEFGRLDILVNNAGISLPQSTIEVTSEETYDCIMDVNLKSAFFLSQMAVPHLEKSGGCIVNMSSALSEIAGPICIAYTMSKAAMDHMTRNMALGLAPKGIRVNSVNPSWVPGTGITREFSDSPHGDPQTTFTKLEISKQPLLGNACVTAEDVAHLVCFLASQRARFVTGQCHIIDGGRTLLGAIVM